MKITIVPSNIIHYFLFVNLINKYIYFDGSKEQADAEGYIVIVFLLQRKNIIK